MSHIVAEEGTTAQGIAAPSYEALHETDTSGAGHARNLVSSGKTGGGDHLSSRIAAPAEVGGKRVPTDSAKTTRLLFDSCLQAVESAIDSEGDKIEQGNAFFTLLDGLGNLWELREGQENQFAQLINLLQTLLLRTERENYDAEQMDSIRRVLKAASFRRPITDQDIAEYVSILSRGGCDVFRALR